MRRGRNQRQVWGVCGFAATVHCYFGHSCLLVFMSSFAEAKEKAQAVQLVVENCSFLGRANALSASIP